MGDRTAEVRGTSVASRPLLIDASFNLRSNRMKMPTNVATLATICAAAGALATVADAQPTTRSVVEQRVDASGL